MYHMPVNYSLHLLELKQNRKKTTTTAKEVYKNELVYSLLWDMMYWTFQEEKAINLCIDLYDL